MTTENQSPEIAVPAPKKPPGLFVEFRTDPKKVADGVWLPTMENGDRLRSRKQWCPEHCRAYLQAVADYEQSIGPDGKVRGEGSAETPEGRRHVEAVAWAAGLVTDWEIKSQPGLAYDRALMAAAFADPQLVDLRAWFKLHTTSRDHFRPDDAAGN